MSWWSTFEPLTKTNDVGSSPLPFKSDHLTLPPSQKEHNSVVVVVVTEGKNEDFLVLIYVVCNYKRKKEILKKECILSSRIPSPLIYMQQMRLNVSYHCFFLSKTKMEVLPPAGWTPPLLRSKVRVYGAVFLCYALSIHIYIYKRDLTCSRPTSSYQYSLKTIFLCENWEYPYALVTFTLRRLRNLKSQNEPRMALLRQK